MEGKSALAPLVELSPVAHDPWILTHTECSYSNWDEVQFTKTSCGSANPTPEVASYGCISGDCPNQESATVCENTGFSKRMFARQFTRL